MHTPWARGGGLKNMALGARFQKLRDGGGVFLSWGLNSQRGRGGGG